jgi:tetratricopeptide (TPR) repeat protein
MNRFYRVSVSFLLILIASACVTTKKKGDVPWLKRNYHNVTTKYNFYYNANVLLQDGITKLNLQHQDNYNQILEMFPYAAVLDTNVVAADMNNAIAKMTAAAAIHKKGDWVDDCALLIGKAQYLKRDYEGAEETLNYLVEEFKPRKAVSKKERKKEAEERKKETKKSSADKKKVTEKKKKETAKQKEKAAKEKAAAKKQAAKDKKAGKRTEKIEKIEKVEPIEIEKTKEKKEDKKDDGLLEFEPKKGSGGAKPKMYLFKQRPAQQEGLAWLARTYTERKQYGDAEEILVKLLSLRSTPRAVRRMAMQNYAYNLLKQKEYAKAVRPLERAIKLTKNKKEKARFYFILGQVQEKLLRDADALEAYDKVLSFKSLSYDMEFSARMNVALFAYTKGAGSSEGAIKSLMKMAKEAKNADYLDQIYFALAQISLKANDRKMAIENLQKSLQYSKKNQSQKAESYIMMAQLYFQDENYLRAKNYYDSTITVLPKTDERYDEAKRLAFGLADIAKNLKIIQLQDSLLRIAAMSPEQQKAFCLRLKQRDIEAIEKAEAAAALAAAGKGNNNDFAISYPPGVTPSTFFAYNFKGLQQGKRSFDQKWGRERKLEDDWRRSNKKAGSSATPLGGGNGEDVVKEDKDAKRDKTKITDEEFRKMMANVPQSSMQIGLANGEVAAAMLGLGIGYREALQRNDKCIKVLEELLRRYPDSKQELEALYTLYGAYTDTENSAKAKECYDKIVKKYPNTTYARILTDPDFLKKAKTQGQELDNYYKATYDAYAKGEYRLALDRSNNADTLFKAKNIYKPKFALLSALCIGSLSGKEKYIAAIKEVIAKFPETAEQKRAKEILRFLDGGESEYNKISGSTVEEGPYKREDDATHYVVVVLKDPNVKVEDVKSSISDFNRDNYKSSNLKISNVFIGANSEIPTMVIRKFDDRAKAMKYYFHVDGVRDVYLPEGIKYEIFAITQNNYKELLRDKSAEKYAAFFDFIYKQK